MKRLGALLIVFAIWLCGGCACAQQMKIQTGSGSLNMRAKASSKSTVMLKIPNGSVVELEETGETWSRISFREKSGYVKTEFLVPYSEEEEAAKAAAKAAAAAAEQLPNSGFGWIETESGSLNIRKKAEGESDVVGRVPNEALVETLDVTKTWSRIAYKGTTGYVRTEYLRLPYELEGEDIFADDGYVFLRSFPDARAQSLAVIRADQPMTIREMTKEWVHVSCFDDIRGEITGFVSVQDVSEYRKMPGERRSADMNVEVSLSTNALAVGDEMDVTVTCDTQATYRYLVYLNGKKIVESEQTPNSVSGYRPRQAGNYRLEVVAYDAQGSAIGCEAFFTVAENTSGEAAESEPYSQKDGWWLDKKYSKRNLDSSGCAIFTLSHALHLLGHAGDAATPQALAKTYPMYLAESGTVTARLLAAAGRDFGFSTQEDKIKSEGEIKRLFGEGAVFSFSVADGHIALAAGLSEDGTKVRVLDSAPSATFERIENSFLYTLDAQGNYQAAATLWDIPGAKYYFETNQFGGLTYYMDLSYVAGRGVRPIKPKN